MIHPLIEWRFECDLPPLGRRVSFLKLPIYPGHGDRYHDQMIVFEFDVSRGGGGGGGGGVGV